MDIRDLARHLNISIGTVSRALNGRSGVHPETRKRVLDAAAKLNYAPNQSGRSLRKGHTHAIAFLLQPHPGDHEFGEPIFMPFLKGVQAVFAKHGLDLIAVMDDPGEAQERLHRIVEARWADAIILAWTRRIDPRIDYLTKVGFPFATFGRSRSGGNTYPSIDFDFVTAGGEAVDRFVGLGHERIAVVTPLPSLNFAHLFRQGYRNGVKRNGLIHDPNLVAAGEVNEAGGYVATKALMDRRDVPSAIIFNNDAMALGGCRALGELGLEPGDRCWPDRRRRQPVCRLFITSIDQLRCAARTDRSPAGGDAACFDVALCRRRGTTDHARGLAARTDGTRERPTTHRPFWVHRNTAVGADGNGMHPLAVHGNARAARNR